MSGGPPPGTRIPPLLAALAAPRPPAWLPGRSELTAAELLTAAAHHGVAPSVARHLAQGTGLSSLTQAPTAGQLHDEKARAAFHLLRWERHARAALQLLGQAGLAPIVFKGGALKYTHYPSPHLRPSRDLDLLLSPTDRVRAERVLSEAGYRLLPSDFRRPFTAVHGHHTGWQKEGFLVELHVSPDYHDAPSLRYEALNERALPLPELHPAARRPADGDHSALLAAHALKHGLLIALRELVDVHLLAAARHEDRSSALAAARSAGLEQVLELLLAAGGTLFVSGRPGPFSGLLSPWRFGFLPPGRHAGDGVLRKLAVHALLTPGWKPTERMVRRYATRRLRDWLWYRSGRSHDAT